MDSSSKFVDDQFSSVKFIFPTQEITLVESSVYSMFSKGEKFCIREFVAINWTKIVLRIRGCCNLADKLMILI